MATTVPMAASSEKFSEARAEVNVIGSFTFSTLMINTLEIVLVPSVAFRVML